MRFFIVCVLAILGHGCANAKWFRNNYQDCGVENVDEQVDELLVQVQLNLDVPTQLDDHSSVLGSLKDGQLWGLNTLVRKGPAKVSCDGDNIRIEIDVVSQEPIKARYEWSQKLTFTTLKGVAYIKANEFEVKLVVIKDKTGQNPSTVQNMDIVHIRDTTVEFTGLAHVGWILSKTTTYLLKYFETALKYALDTPLTRVFDKVLLESHIKDHAQKIIY